jgi:diketogulonate reductase-like aldo/keto reductase
MQVFVMFLSELLQVFDFSLSSEDMEDLTKLNKNQPYFDAAAL